MQERLERAAVAVMKRRKMTTGRRRAYLTSRDSSASSGVGDGSQSVAEVSIYGSAGSGRSSQPGGEGSDSSGFDEIPRRTPQPVGSSPLHEGAPAGEAAVSAGEEDAKRGEGSSLPAEGAETDLSGAASPPRAAPKLRAASRAVSRKGATTGLHSMSLSTVALAPSMKEREAKLLVYMDFMLNVYRVEFWWWEIAEILRKLALTGVLSLIAPGSVMQVAAGCVVSFGFVLMCVQPGVKGHPTTSVRRVFDLRQQAESARTCTFRMAQAFCFVQRRLVVAELLRGVSNDLRSMSNRLTHCTAGTPSCARSPDRVPTL